MASAVVPRLQRPITVALFDLDGTLVDTNSLIIQSFQHVLLTRLQRVVGDDEIRGWFGEPLWQTFRRFTSDEAEVDALVSLYRTWNVAKHDELIREFDGVREAVAALAAAGIKLAIVTSKITSTALLGLRACRLTEFFPVVVGLDATAAHKPDAAPALRALELLGEASGEHVAFIGDSHLDILCGRNAGVVTIAVGWTALARDTINAAEPHMWVETPAELTKLLVPPASGPPA